MCICRFGALKYQAAVSMFRSGSKHNSAPLCLLILSLSLYRKSCSSRGNTAALPVSQHRAWPTVVYRSYRQQSCYLDEFGRGQHGLVGHGGGRHHHAGVVLLLQPLVEHLHVEEAQEAQSAPRKGRG